MARPCYLLLFYIFFAIFITSLNGRNIDATDDERKVNIVYMGSLPKGHYSPTEHHLRMLHEVVKESNSRELLVRSYKRSFNGFAAYLTNEEQRKLQAHKDVVWVFPSETYQLHTTSSWDFTGFPLNVQRNLSMESDIIIGVFDTGIWPESKSFTDDGFGPIPKRWKGTCQLEDNFSCNKKIIGARYYGSDDSKRGVLVSARDYAGHGTHVASTAAGNIVKDASFYGIAKGIARGGVPSARIAVYTVCPKFGECRGYDVLAAFDDAIADGVDIITISLGPMHPPELKQDVVAIGSFHAALKNILTVNSAGNLGYSGGVTSVAPWLFSVGASSINRKIISKVVLGNGTMTLMGNATNAFALNGTTFPLVYGKDASTRCSESWARDCRQKCLDKNLVKGKIVMCMDFNGIFEAMEAEALGCIVLPSEKGDSSSIVVPYAASVLNYSQYKTVESYYDSTKMAQANVLKSESIVDVSAPVVASFSSRGPNKIFPDILKPDIVAPGVDILAAFSPEGCPSDYEDSDARRVDYSILSGTSMSCPHVTGAAAYVKSLHPNWSSSAIKSALMTTARRMNSSNTIHGDAEFSYGAGHFDPVKATNPGLVYETFKEDYAKMICGLGYDSSLIETLFGDNTTCTGLIPTKTKDLNYPTMTTSVGLKGAFVIEFIRTVTNVGVPNSTYNATITKTSQCNITVVPNILPFKALNERKSFNVSVSIAESAENFTSASLEWSDGIHIVRSPIVVYRKEN